MKFVSFMRVAVVVLLSTFNVLTGCSSQDQTTSAFVHGLENMSGALKVGQELRMDIVNNGEWDRMFVFAPYTPRSEIEAAMKLKVSSVIERERVSERDDINLLVFLNGNTIQTVVAIPRQVVDFSVAKEVQPLSRNSAVFKKVSLGGVFVLADNKSP